MQLIEWCDNGEMTREQIGKCIDVFNGVGELLAKMIGKEKYESVFELVKKEVWRNEKIKRDWVSASPPWGSKKSSTAHVRQVCVMKPRNEPRNIWWKPTEFRAVLNLNINAGNSRAQCLSKLGRCLVKEGQFSEGKEKIQRAIDIRQRHGEEDIVMLAATYNDMAGMCHLLFMHPQFQRNTVTVNSLVRQHSTMTPAKSLATTNRIGILTH